MKCILSTKKLNSEQRNLFRNDEVTLVDYDAIQITFVDFEIPENAKNIIFTSKNAVKAFLTKYDTNLYKTKYTIFCVGKKTKALLERNGHKVKKMANYASELSEFIQKHHKNDVFYFFCGNLRREELPLSLKAANISLFEVKTYETELILTKFDQKWSKILFFSPSGVQSFTTYNSINVSEAICIGDTTASEARKHTSNVTIAKETTIESVIETAIEKLKV